MLLRCIDWVGQTDLARAYQFKMPNRYSNRDWQSYPQAERLFFCCLICVAVNFFDSAGVAGTLLEVTSAPLGYGAHPKLDSLAASRHSEGESDWMTEDGRSFCSMPLTEKGEMLSNRRFSAF